MPSLRRMMSGGYPGGRKALYREGCWGRGGNAGDSGRKLRERRPHLPPVKKGHGKGVLLGKSGRIRRGVKGKNVRRGKTGRSR